MIYIYIYVLDWQINIITLDSKLFSPQKGLYVLTNWYLKYIFHPENYPSSSPSLPSSSTSISSTNSAQEEAFVSDNSLTKQAQLRLSCIIPINNTISLCCISPLFEYMKRQSVRFESNLIPMSIKLFTLQNIMHIPSDVLHSLQIFNTNTHPNMHQKEGKESTSLFNLLDHTVSTGGKSLIKQWILQPTLDKRILAIRHTSIQFITSIETGTGAGIIMELRTHLKHIKNIPRILSHIHEHRATSTEWHHLLQFIYYVLKIIDSIQRFTIMTGTLFEKVLSIVNADLLVQLGKIINDMISFDESKSEGRIIIKSGLYEDLDTLHIKYNCLDDYLLQVAQEISSKLPSTIGAFLNVIYFPQLGYIITLPKTKVSRTDHPLGFELQFTTSEYYYYKNEKTNELDETLGDIHAMIVDREIEIVQHLGENILQYQESLLLITNTLSELDCILSFSLTALQQNYIKPQITENNDLIIVKGRHPLYELKDTFIANDTYLVGGMGIGTHSSSSLSININNDTPAVSTLSELLDQPNSVLLLTGANYSGKSVYLKQIGLIVYMTQIGSFVPADKAILGITDKIFTSIQTSDTVSMVHSAFSYDLQQISQAIHYATEKSLVIIDEFGKSTNVINGESLFGGILTYYIAKGKSCPKVAASTHFHDLMMKGVLNEDYISFYTTEIMRDSFTDTSSSLLSTTSHHPPFNNIDSFSEQVIFLYKIVPGKSIESSYGQWCASLGGIPENIIQRSHQLTDIFLNGKKYDLLYSKNEEERYEKMTILLNQFIQNDDDNMNETIMNSLMALFK
ncbi:unnamed protein product [Cunninghamella blakesleeana]